MSVVALSAALVSRLATVSGIVASLDYEPTAIHSAPLIYTLLDSIPSRTPRPGAAPPSVAIAATFRFQHTIVVKWTDNDQAEETLRTLIDATLAVIDADARLGGVVTDGFCRATEVQTGFLLVAKTLYRVADVFTETVFK